MKCLIIDNYDSFTYNLVHLVKELGLIPEVKRNDKFTLEETAEMVGMSVSGIRKRLRNLRDRGLTTKEVM